MSNLQKRLDVLPEKWEYEEGDKLYGELVDIGTYTGKFEPCTVITVLALEDGSTEKGGAAIPSGAERRFYGSPESARNQLEQQRPQVGDRIGVKYHGLGDARPGESAPHRFRILVEKASGTATFEPDDFSGSIRKKGGGDDEIPF